MVYKIKKGNYLDRILRTHQTVFSLQDLAILWEEPIGQSARVRLSYYVKKGYLHSIRRGLYAKDIHYNRLELASKVFTPAYVSLETILLREGVIFQLYETIYVASYVTRRITIEGQDYMFRRINPKILINRLGIVEENGVFMACKERAMLDRLYLTPHYYFDNLRVINWDKAREIVKIYHSPTMVKRLEKYYAAEQNST